MATKKKSKKPRSMARTSATLLAWKRATTRLEKARIAMGQAERDIENLDRLHREEHPLSNDTKRTIVVAFRGGKRLCCEAGRKVLADLGLDDCWIEHLNDWAYEHLGCSPEWNLGGEWYRVGEAKLCDKLDYHGGEF